MNAIVALMATRLPNVHDKHQRLAELKAMLVEHKDNPEVIDFIKSEIQLVEILDEEQYQYGRKNRKF